METVLFKAAAFVLLILLGMSLKKKGVFPESAADVLSRILTTITLPAAVINSFCDYQKDPALYWLVLLGLGGNLLMYGVGWLLSARGSREDRALFTMTCPGYNIGAFTLPFVQSFLPSGGVIATCMFDAGNSIMCTGGSYALSATFLESGKAPGERLRAFGRRLFSSIPFDVYLLMVVLTLLDIAIPEAIGRLVEPAAQANGFVAMFMIGLMFRFEAKRTYVKTATLILAVRYLSALVLAAVSFWCLPFDLLVRQTLVLAFLSPSTVLAPVFTKNLGGDYGLSSFVGSVSIIISVVLMTGFVLIMGAA